MPSTNIFATKESVFFVGGRGTKAGDADAGGGCTKAIWGDIKAPSLTLSDIMGTNGEPLSAANAWDGSQTACVVSNPGGYARFTKVGAFSNCIVGLIARCVTTGCIPDVDDYYEITAVNDDYVDINLAMAVGGTGDIKVGGAFEKLQTAADNTMAQHVDGCNDCNILTNKDETFAGVGDKIDTDVGFGSLEFNTFKRIIGIDDDGVELVAYSYTTYDGDGNGCMVFDFGGPLENMDVKHLFATNVTGFLKAAIFIFPSSGDSVGLSFYDCGCSATANSAQGVRIPTSNIKGVLFQRGEYSSFSGSVFYCNTCYGMTLQDVIIDGSNIDNPLVFANPYGIINITGCVFIGHNHASCVGIKNSNSYCYLIVTHNIFYDVYHGIQKPAFAHVSSLVEHSNIFVVSDKTVGKAIDWENGSLQYSDYSCLWAIDGAPVAAERWGGKGKGEHSIEQDPLFFDVANQDFRLKMNSPCKRKGKPTLGKV